MSDQETKAEETGFDSYDIPEEKEKEKESRADDFVGNTTRGRTIGVTGRDQQVYTKTRALLDKEKKVEIMIPSTEQHKDDVVIVINTYAFQIQRDKWVKVPLSVKLQLDNMTQTNYVQRKRDGENQEGNELVPVIVSRIPFQARL